MANTGLVKPLTKVFSNKILSALIIAVVSAFANLSYQWYLQPKLVLNSAHQYSKVGKQAVGSVQIINLGRSTAEDIVIRVVAPIEREDDAQVLIQGASLEHETRLYPDYTDFFIKKLNRYEDAFISFIPKEADDTFFDVFFWSKTGREEELEWPSEWWDFDRVQVGFILVLVTSAILGGYLLGEKGRRRR